MLRVSFISFVIFGVVAMTDFGDGNTITATT